MSLAKFDELDSIIRGMLYIETTNPHECYYWANPTCDEKCRKVPYDFSEPYPFLVSFNSTRVSIPVSHLLNLNIDKRILKMKNFLLITGCKYWIWCKCVSSLWPQHL